VGAGAARRRDPLPDFRHFIAEAGEGWPSAGFVILQGCRNPHGAVELKRIVLQPKGLGYGRALVRLLAEMAFRDLGAHRFWLDVKENNARALALYRDEGFVEEGGCATASERRRLASR
jgi:ribosomal protein S18 acetylase RimI-like enzyme